jgi:uncharacterized protein YjbJ (UPF0337 family)
VSTKNKADELKGRAKEAAGAVTDDNQLRDEGRRDQAGAKLKQAGDKLVDAAKDAADAVKPR